jgi:HK97 family phage prohead protease
LQNDTPAVAARFGGNVEARLIQHPCARAGVAANDRKVRLLLVPYNSVSIPIGGIREVYAPGAFADGLNEDPRALFAHNEEKVIGRTSAGTARFWEQRDGVYCEAVGPDTVWFNDLLQSLRRGDINQASAAFWIVRSHAETRAGERVRVVDRAILRDGSIVSFAAYEATTAAADAPDLNENEAAALALLRLR